MNPLQQLLAQNQQQSQASPEMQQTPMQGDANPLTAMTQQAQPQQMGQPQQRQPIKLSHQQVKAALTHFHTVQKYFNDLMKDPKLGKENVRPDVFERSAKLLADGILTLPQVMNELKTLPKDPVDQKDWVKQHLSNSVAAQNQVLQDYAATADDDHFGDQQGEDPSHTDAMTALMGAYKR